MTNLNEGQINDLNLLISGMTDQERSHALAFLQCFSMQASPTKVEQLFQHLLERSPQPGAETQLPPEAATPAPDRFVVGRLQHKLQESLLLGINCQADCRHSAYLRQRILISKRLLRAEVLRERGLCEQACALAARAGGRAHSMGMPDLHAQALQLQLAMAAPGKLSALLAEWEASQSFLNAVLRARAMRLQWQDMRLRAAIPEERLAWLRGELEQLSRLQGRCAETELLHLQWQIALAAQRGQTSLLRSFAIELPGRLDELEMPADPAWVCEVYTELAWGFLRNRLPEICLEQTVQGLQHAVPGSPESERLQALEGHAILASFPRDKFLAKLRILRRYAELARHPRQEQTLQLMLAGIHFCQGRYPEAGKILNDIRLLQRDKAGYNIGMRVLQIMVEVERGRLDDIDLLVDAYRKHLARTRKTLFVPERYALLLQALNKLVRRGFNFRITNRKAPELLQALKANSGPCAWQPGPLEPLPFHTWWMHKLQN